MANIVQFQQLSTSKQSEWVDRLFARLGAMYGNKFSAMWEGQSLVAVKDIWREDLAEFTPDEISHGVASCKTRDWPPTLPEFVKMCRPAIDYERAFLDATEQMQLRKSGKDAWPVAALFWAANKLGGDLERFAYRDISARWAKALDDSHEAVRSGRMPSVIPPRMESLPAPGNTMIDREQATKRIAQLRAMLSKKPEVV